MFNPSMYEVKHYPKSAHEIAARARERERELAQLRLQHRADAAESKSRKANPFVWLVTTLFGV